MTRQDTLDADQQREEPVNITDPDIIRQKLEDFGPERWLEALQSSRYRHIRAQLGYVVQTNVVHACCLGVLVHAAEAYLRADDEIMCDGSALSIPSNVLPSWLDEWQHADLIDINDADSTYDYTRQMAYIAEHILPKWRAEKILTEGV